MQAINNTNMKKIEIIEQIYYNNLEIKELTKSRDTLFPKLLSGEIDVSKVEI